MLEICEDLSLEGNEGQQGGSVKVGKGKFLDIAFTCQDPPTGCMMRISSLKRIHNWREAALPGRQGKLCNVSPVLPEEGVHVEVSLHQFRLLPIEPILPILGLVGVLFGFVLRLPFLRHHASPSLANDQVHLLGALQGCSNAFLALDVNVFFWKIEFIVIIETFRKNEILYLITLNFGNTF
jgi:hypothetical protein